MVRRGASPRRPMGDSPGVFGQDEARRPERSWRPAQQWRFFGLIVSGDFLNNGN